MRGYVVAAALQRHIVAQILAAYNNARGVHTRLARHVLQCNRQIYHPFHGIILVNFHELGHALVFSVQPESVGKRRVERNKLGNFVALRIRYTQHAAHVLYGVFRLHPAEGDNLSNSRLGVFFNNVIDDLAPPVHAEVYVEVGHAHSFGVEKPLENQTVAQRLHLGYAYGVSDNAACAAAATGTYGYAVLVGVVYEIPDYEIILHKSHFGHHLKLVVGSLADFGSYFLVASFQSLFHKVFQKLVRRHAVVGLVRRQQRLFLDGYVAFFRNFESVFQRLRHKGKLLRHFVVILEIKLRALEAHAAGVVVKLSRLHAKQYVLHFRVGLLEIMHVVGGDKLHAELLGDFYQLGHDVNFVRNAVILNFYVIIVLEKLLVLGYELSRLLPHAVAQQARQLSRNARGQTDKPLAVLAQSLEIYAGLVIITVHKAYGIELDQIFVAYVVFGNQNQMVEFALDVSAFDRQVVHHIKFAADDGLYALFLCQTIKMIRAVHISVIGDGNGGHVFFLAGVEQRVYTRRAVQKTVFCMQMKMNKRFFRHFYLLYVLSLCFYP